MESIHDESTCTESAYTIEHRICVTTCVCDIIIRSAGPAKAGPVGPAATPLLQSVLCDKKSNSSHQMFSAGGGRGGGGGMDSWPGDYISSYWLRARFGTV